MYIGQLTGRVSVFISYVRQNTEYLTHSNNANDTRLGYGSVSRTGLKKGKLTEQGG